MEAGYRRSLLKAGKELPPVSRIPSEVVLDSDANAFILDDDYSTICDLYAASPAQGHRPPKSIVDEELSALDDVVAHEPLENTTPDPPSGRPKPKHDHTIKHAHFSGLPWSCRPLDKASAYR